MKEKLIQLVGVIFGIIVVYFLIAFGMKMQGNHDEKYPWKASIFKKSNVESITDSKDFKTLDECRSWTADRANELGYKEGDWDYNCGKGCEYKDDSIVSGKRVKTYDCAELEK